MSYAIPRRAAVRSLSALGALGSVDDPMDDDFGDDLGDRSSDPRSAYLAWAAAVKRYGGTVVSFPSHQTGSVPVANNNPMNYGEASSGLTTGDRYGLASARYPIDAIFPPPDYSLSTLFHRAPDAYSADSAYGFYIAPLAVLQYANTNTHGNITTPQVVPGEPVPPNPKWYDDLLKLLSEGKWVIGGLLVLAGLSFLPRRRS